jgi:hypothetical protein
MHGRNHLIFMGKRTDECIHTQKSDRANKSCSIKTLLITINIALRLNNSIMCSCCCCLSRIDYQKAADTIKCPRFYGELSKIEIVMASIEFFSLFFSPPSKFDNIIIKFINLLLETTRRQQIEIERKMSGDTRSLALARSERMFNDLLSPR